MSRDVNPMRGSCNYADTIASEIRQHFGEPASVIELGCGCGRNLAKFARAERVGIDPHRANVKRARSVAQGANIILGSHLSLASFTSNKFDVGYTCSVLDHMEDFVPALHDLCRVAKRVMLFEPVIKGPSRQARKDETGCWKISWYHDIEAWLGSQRDLTFTCAPMPMYETNSGPMFHQFIIRNRY